MISIRCTLLVVKIMSYVSVTYVLFSKRSLMSHSYKQKRKRNKNHGIQPTWWFINSNQDEIFFGFVHLRCVKMDEHPMIWVVDTGVAVKKSLRYFSFQKYYYIISSFRLYNLNNYTLMKIDDSFQGTKNRMSFFILTK